MEDLSNLYAYCSSHINKAESKKQNFVILLKMSQLTRTDKQIESESISMSISYDSHMTFR